MYKIFYIRDEMDYQNLAKQITLLRKSKKISQLQMAKDLNISRATISSFENENTHDIGIKKVIQILDYLNFELCFKEKSPFPTFEELKNEQ